MGASITLLVVWIYTRIAQRRTKEQEVSRRPQVQLGLGGFVFTSGHEISEVVCVVFPSAYDEAVTGIFPVPFTVINKGQKSLKNAVLGIQASTDVLVCDRKPVEFEPMFANFQERVKRTITNAGHLNFVAFQIESIDPGMGLNFAELIQLKPWLETKFNFPVQTKDGVKLNAQVELPIHFTCLVSIIGEDFPPVTISFVFDCLHATSLSDAKRRWMEINRGSKRFSQICAVTFMQFEQDIAQKIDGNTVIFMKVENMESVRELVHLR
jgi:hypothetical protein